MIGLTIRRASTAEATPLEAAQKILDGISVLAAWAIYEVRQLARGHKVEAVLQQAQARIDAERLCTACGEAVENTRRMREARRNAPTEHPDQTKVHLGPHPVVHPAAPNGLHPRAAPAIVHTAMHPRAMGRHH